MKLIQIFTFIFILVKSESETVDVTLTNYDAMYQNECSTSSTTISPKGDSNQEKTAFCKCLAATKASGKSYDKSQNDFSKCMQKANGDDASHWEKIAQKYSHKYSVEVDPDSWELPHITTSTPVTVGPTNSNSNDDSSDEPLSTKNYVSDAMLMNMDIDNGNSNNENNNSFDNILLYGTLIGSFILLLIFIWFIKNTFKKWKMREYQFVNQMSESEANTKGDPYGSNHNDDDWDDNYDLNYEQNKDHKKDKKNKFSGWNQYSAV